MPSCRLIVASTAGGTAEAHRGELQSESETVGIAALLDDRPELHKLLSQLRKGDVLVVWTLDRLSRSLRDVLTIMERVQERHAGFRSLKEAVGIAALLDDRPELHKLLSQLRKGDVLVVWTLDRLSRSLRDVLTIMERVQERHAGFRSLKEAVDTTTPAGRMMMQMVGAFAEFERAMLKERTKAGLDAARKEGRIGGRPTKLKPHQQQEIVTLVKQGKKTAAAAARLFGVHPATVSRLLRRT